MQEMPIKSTFQASQRTEVLLRQLEELDISNVDLARLIDMAPSSVQRWTAGTHEPPLMLLRLLECMLTVRRFGVAVEQCFRKDWL